MSLHNISFCRYLTKPVNWTDDHYRVLALVRAVKGYSVKGYAVFKIGSTFKTLDAAHPEVAFEWFAERVATGLEFTGKTFLCPIPGSECTPTSNEVSRTLLLAQKIVERVPKLTLWPHLKFNKPMQKKIRNEDTLYASLVCTAPVPKGDFLLLDDVCTSGAHARAAERRLIDSGAKGEIKAMSLARTMLEPGEKVFGYREDDI
jgi:hypothetical protein